MNACLRGAQGFPALRALDLSFNCLGSLGAVLASLAQLGPCLQQLRLNDNPLQDQQQPAHHQFFGPPQRVERGGGHTHCYAAAVLRALPHLADLDSLPEVGGAQRRRRRIASPCRAEGDADWEARTVLWALANPADAAEVEVLGRQLHASSTRPATTSLAAVLEGLFQAASASAVCNCSGRQAMLGQARRQYLHLAALSAPRSAQALLVIVPTHYRQVLARLAAAAKSIQAAWRGWAARRRCARLAAEARARQQAASACRVQAAWRGWASRHRHYAGVQHSLAQWRQLWREAQEQVAEHERCWAAVHIQASAWCGVVWC